MPHRKRETRRPVDAVTGFGEPRPLTRRAALLALGPVVYAVRCGDTIKIGHTRDLSNRMSGLHADELLAVMPGTYDDEQALHARLVDHRHHGHEWYYPTPGVLAIVNEMRDRIGLQPVA